MSGPPRTPTALASVRNFPSKRARNHREPIPGKLTDLTPPADLDDSAASQWRMYAAGLHAAGVLTTADVPIFRAICQGQALAGRFYAVLQDKPLTHLTTGGDATIPEFAGWLKATTLLKSLWAELGMTPAARSRIAVGGSDLNSDAFAAHQQTKPRRHPA